MQPSTFQILNFRTNKTNGTGAIAVKIRPNAINKAQVGYGI